MKYKNTLLVAQNIEKSVLFYKTVLGLRVKSNYGENVVLTGGISLQSKNSFEKFIPKEDFKITLGGNDSEIYFEENNFEAFLKKLELLPINYVHPPLEHAWGQRVVRFYDPDMHIIEVGETLKDVCKRFIKKGLTVEEEKKKTGIPVKNCKKWCK